MNIQEELMQGKVWIESALKKGGETHDFKDIVDGVVSGHMVIKAIELNKLLTCTMMQWHGVNYKVVMV